MNVSLSPDAAPPQRTDEASAVEIVEVGPRDGLQNEPDPFDTEAKIELIRRAIAAGAGRLEIASFVNPTRAPQMADAENVVARVPRAPGLTRVGLVLNERGAARALATDIDELGAVAVASDAFGVRNQGQTWEESVTVAAAIVAQARAAGRTAQATIAVACGCPFEGEVPAARVVEMARRLAASGAREIGLADTIGVGVPAQVKALVRSVRAAIGAVPLRAHFHNTRNTGLANAWSAFEEGVRVLDSSIGGIGGCPFAPRATGNIATEDLCYMLERSGVRTGLDLDRLISASKWLGAKMGRTLPAMVSRAGGFPAAALQGLAQ